MTNTFPSRPAINPLRHGKAPGEAEIVALLHLLPAPALFLDHQHALVVSANSAFLQLTAFALNEISGQNVRDLIEGLPQPPLSPDSVIQASLVRRKRAPIPVTISVRMLDSAGKWLILQFEPEEENRKSLFSRIEQVFQTLQQLNHAPGEDHLRKSLVRAVTVIRELLEASTVGVYRRDTDKSGVEVWKVAEDGEEGILPENLPAEDMESLAQTVVWKPGRRVQNELHRVARVQNLAYLASTSAGQDGLLVIADRKQGAPELLEEVLAAMGQQISRLQEQAMYAMELRRRAVENRRELSVWRTVGENAQEGILLLGPDLTVKEMNQAAEWMLGYADWEARGMPVENILIGPDRLAPALETACQGIPTHNMGSLSLHHRNGHAFPARIQILPVQREGETLGVVIFFNDISENEEIRNRTQQLEQRAVLGEVTAVFAHEVRNPINNISTGLQLLSVKLPVDDPNQENITRLLHDCQRLEHLMESVLNFSRHGEHKLEPVDLPGLLNRILERWRPRMAKVNVKPFFQADADISQVMGDPRALEQVFTNLISNAVDAMSDKGGTLAVRVMPFHVPPAMPQVEVTVSDTGPGIADEIKERIFEPFVTTKSQGTGLGLAITKRIVTSHKGSISVNTFPGGTVFHVYLSASQGENG